MERRLGQSSRLVVRVCQVKPFIDPPVLNLGHSALTQLDSSCRAPADKAAVLVASHRIIVGTSERCRAPEGLIVLLSTDGLSRLPPIKLKPEDEMLDEKTPMAGTFGHRAVDEEDDNVASPLEQSGSGTFHDSPTVVFRESPTVVLSPESEYTPSGPLSNISKDDDGAAHGSPADESRSLQPPHRAPSPCLTISPPPPPSSPTPVSGDIILPLMIFAAVKANPPHLVSNLLYTQRFRNQAGGGEEGYCLINLMAVAEFLENVDLAALGLGESEKTVIRWARVTCLT